jgi:hypothetical protein
VTLPALPVESDPPLPTVVAGVPPAPVVDVLVEDAPPPVFPDDESDPQPSTAIAIAAPTKIETKDTNFMTVISFSATLTTSPFRRWPRCRDRKIASRTAHVLVPVFWQDNYASLMGRETRTVGATYSLSDVLP